MVGRFPSWNVRRPSVVQPAKPLDVTAEYREESPAALPSDRVRVALVAGSGTATSDDVYRLLRRRLLILASIIAGGFLAGFVLDLISAALAILPSESAGEWLVRRWRSFVNIAVSGGVAILLWRRPPQSVRGLRVIEIILIGTMTFVALNVSVNPIAYGFLQQAPQEPERIAEAFVQRYAATGVVVWMVTILLYGTLIPNTARRCALVTGAIAVSPLILFSVYAYGLKPLDRRIAAEILLGLGFWNTLSVVISVFACARIEGLRQQAAEARKLGQYVLKEQLGAGGMGEVFRAEHALLRRPCAIKIIRPERAGDPRNLRRFEREVQTTATLTHPNTVHIYDYGHTADGTFYYVMEYLPGLTLEELVKAAGPLPPGRAVHLLRQVCAALMEAHARGFIHRDIKPGNVMICERGGNPDVAKLLDFGLVLPPVGDFDGEKLTQDGSVTGTPAYLSPEQAGGQEAVDSRSDIYSLGALAYFLLTGQPPFANRTSVKMLAAHLYEAPNPPSSLRPEIPATLDAVVLRCLAKDPAARFQSAAALDAALAECRSNGWTEAEARRWWNERSANVRPRGPGTEPTRTA